MKYKDLGRKEAKECEEIKEDERADSPLATVRSSRKKAPRVGEAPDTGGFDKPFTGQDQTEDSPAVPKSNGKTIALAPPRSAAPSDRSSARGPSSEDSGTPKKKLAIAPAIPLEALRETDCTQDDDSDKFNTQGQTILLSEVAGADIETVVAPNGSSSADSRSEDDLEQDMSVIDASVMPSASPEGGAFVGEVFEEPPLAGAVVERCGMDPRKRNAVIVVALIVIIACLVIGLLFGLKGNDQISVPYQPPVIDGNWIQLGQEDLVGEANGDSFGLSIALSADGSIVAVGARLNDYIDTADSQRGSVHVYTLNGTSWNQMGGVIRGKNEGDYFGESVALSADGRTVAGGAPQYIKDGDPTGYAMIHRREEVDE